MIQHDESWFLAHLELQLEDQVRKRDGLPVVTYLDAADVRDAVLGVDAFYRGMVFDRDAFLAPRTLVACLASAGRLGPFEMLPTHQAEFYRLFRRDFAVDEARTDDRLRIDQFLADAGLTDDMVDIDALASMEPVRLEEIVHREAGKAELLFRTFHSISATWRVRIIKWDRQRLLVTRPDHDIDYGETVGSKPFRVLKAALDEMRPNRGTSNFADAIALCHLIERVARFRRDQREPLPRFFASTPLLRKALAHTGLEPELFYKDSVSVIADADYFVFRAMFNRPTSESAFGQGSIGELEDLRSEASAIRQGRALTRGRDDAVTGHRVTELVNEFKQFSFFEHVWLTSVGALEVRQAAQDYVEIHQKLKNNPEFVKQLQVEVEEARAELKRSAEEYESIHELWKAFQDLPDPWRGWRGDRALRDFFREKGLLRFGFAETHREAVTSLLHRLYSGDDVLQQEAVTSLIIPAQRSRRHSMSEENLTALVAALWVSNRFNAILDVLDPPERLGRPFRAIYAAAALFARQRVDVATDLIEELSAEFEQETDRETRSQLAIAVAYLSYHLWKLREGLRRQVRSGSAPGSVDDSYLITRSISMAAYASEMLEEDDCRRAYALNQYIFYSIAAGDAERSVLAEVAQKLQAYKSREDVWQYRFDGTLARYFRFLAQQPSDNERKIKHLRTAEKLADEAYDECFGDPQIEDIRSAIAIDLDAVEEEIASRGKPRSVHNT